MSSPPDPARFLAWYDGLSGSPRERLSELCRRLRADFPHYNWVGIYVVEGHELVLWAWDGREATEHVRIPVDKGLCGMAVREGRTVTVGNVDSNPEYLACFPYTRSEIVVPIFRGTVAIGEIDIDGEARNAYGPGDQAFLEELARHLTSTVTALAPSSSNPVA